MNAIVKFFHGIGHLLGKAMGIVRDSVTDEQLAHGVALVKQAEEQFVDNTSKREWVVSVLMTTFHLPEGVARIVVELGLKLVKQEAGAAIDKAAAAGQ